MAVLARLATFMIRLETSRRTGIENHQDNEISTFHLNWARDLGRLHPRARPRTSTSALYNCHGLTFASRRTRIEKSAGSKLSWLTIATRKSPMCD